MLFKLSGCLSHRFDGALSSVSFAVSCKSSLDQLIIPRPHTDTAQCYWLQCGHRLERPCCMSFKLRRMYLHWNKRSILSRNHADTSPTPKRQKPKSQRHTGAEILRKGLLGAVYCHKRHNKGLLLQGLFRPRYDPRPPSCLWHFSCPVVRLILPSSGRVLAPETPKGSGPEGLWVQRPWGSWLV